MTVKIKRRLLLGRNVMTNLDSILKSRDITLPTKVCPVKAMVFPVVMHGCESWTIKKAEHWQIDAFEMWCWRRLLRVLWTSRRSNQSILKEINPEYSLEALMLKLKLQYFGYPMPRTDSLEKTLMLGKMGAGGGGDDRGWDGWMASLTQWTWVWAHSGSWWWTGRPGVLQSMGSQSVGHHWATGLNWKRTRGIKAGIWSLSGEDALQEGMATHSSILAWRIPQTEEPGGLQSIGSQRVKLWSDLAKKTRQPKLRNLVLFFVWADVRAASKKSFLSYAPQRSGARTQFSHPQLPESSAASSRCSLTAAGWHVFSVSSLSFLGPASSHWRAAIANDRAILCLLA